MFPDVETGTKCAGDGLPRPQFLAASSNHSTPLAIVPRAQPERLVLRWRGEDRDHGEGTKAASDQINQAALLPHEQ